MKEEFKNLQTHSQLQERIIESSLKLVERLGNVTKGNDKEFDTKLAKLRKSSRQATSPDELLAQLQGSFSSAHKLEKNQVAALRELKDNLVISGQALQNTKGLDPTLRRKLRMVLNKLNAMDAYVLSELIPQTLALLGLFLSVQGEANKATSSDKDEVSGIDEKVLSGLVNGMNKLSTNDVIKPQLNEFNKRMELARTDLEQLDLCLQFFEEVVDHFSQEYLQTQKLIVNINAALEDVHQTLLQSIKSSKNYGDQLQELNIKIDRQIAELSKNAGEATSIVELQFIIDKKLNAITDSIKERDGIERQRTIELDTTLQNMESKLATLEQRTEFYRNKWLEEKVKSDTDALTGLPNRGAYDKRFNEEYKRWLRSSEPMCLAVIDIDHFKKINDVYGHSVGDKTLQVVTKTIRKSMRNTDFLARYGGEEFVCLLFNTELRNVLKPLEKVKNSVQSIPFKVKNDPLNITISIGVTQLIKSDNVHTVFDRADKALYEAKETGRNKICYKK